MMPFFKACKANGIASKGGMNITKNLGMLLLAIYLILIGITALIHTIAIPVLPASSIIRSLLHARLAIRQWSGR